MSKKFKLSISDPCHENWDNMSQAEKGRFCSSCQKQVIDFTNMSDSQLAAFFKKPTGGSVCGRFYDDQLDRTIEITKKRIPWVRYFFQFAMPAFLLSMKATAQGKVKITTAANKTPVPYCSKITGNIMPVEKKQLIGDRISAPVANNVFIKGKVVGENNDSIPFATIMMKGTSHGVAADKNGEFTIQNISGKDVVMTVSAVSYIEKDILLPKNTDLSKEIIIRLNHRVAEDIPVIVRSHSSRTVGLLTRVWVTREKATPVIKELSETLPTAKIYPNPVNRNDFFYIEFITQNKETVQLRVVSMSGSMIYFRSELVTKGVNRLSVASDPKWAAGIYIIQIRNEKGTVIKQEKLIVQ